MNVKSRMTSRIEKIRKLLVVAVFLLVVSVYGISSIAVKGEDYASAAVGTNATSGEIESFEDLKRAIANGGTFTLKNGVDIFMTEPLTVTKNVTISGTGTIRRTVDMGTSPMFTVKNNITFTLGSGVTMSGYPGTTKDDQAYDHNIWPYDLDDNAFYDEHKPVLLPVGDEFGKNGFYVLAGHTNTIENVNAMSREDAWNYVRSDNGAKWMTYYFRQCYAGDTREQQLGNMPADAQKYGDHTVIRSVDCPDYFLFVDSNGDLKAGKINLTTTGFINDDVNNKFWFTKSEIQNDEPTPGLVWMNYNGAGTDANPYKCSWTEFVQDYKKGVPTGDAKTVTDTVDTNYVWSNAKAPSSETESKGFFIQVESGTLTIKDGVTFEDLNTECNYNKQNKTYSSGTVKNLAPIYVTGGSTLNMEGGVIKNNNIGYGADDNDSSSSVQWIKQVIGEDAKPTNTAGGIIASGSGTNVYIKGKSKIENNLADAGAIIVKDSAKVTMDKDSAGNKPEISSNVGWHHAGGVLTENGATLHLIDGKINNNTAWGKGGAVWATEWGTVGWPIWESYPNKFKNESARAGRTGGNFIMEGGELKNNFAFTRAGAIEVESNGVQLIGGTIEGNKCKSLGGAIYVEGDSPVYTYSLLIKNGYIGGNTAVKGANSELDKGLSGTSRVAGNTYKPYHYDYDFAYWEADGDGGGVWICPMGGTSVFTSNANNSVYIDNNTAGRSGNDFFVSAKKGSALVQNLLGDWKYDDGTPLGKIAETGKIITGRTGMYNDVSPAYSQSNTTGVKIINNMSRDGGGIAANGTVIMGEAEDVYRFEAELEIKKDWAAGVTAVPVTIGLYYQYEGKPYLLNAVVVKKDSDTKESVKYEIELGTDPVKPTDDNPEKENPEVTNVIYKTDAWTARASIPAYVDHWDADKKKTVRIPLFYIKDPDDSSKDLDLTTPAGVKRLYEYIDDNKDTDGYTSLDALGITWNLSIQETGDKYELEEISFNGSGKAQIVTDVELRDSAGNKVQGGAFKVGTSTITFKQSIKNSLKDIKVEFVKSDRLDKSKTFTDAEFDLYHAYKENDSYGGKYQIEGKSANSKINDNPITAKDGKYVLPITEPGAYLLYETKAPSGYKTAVTPWVILVDGSGKVEFYQVSSKPDNPANNWIVEYETRLKSWYSNSIFEAYYFLDNFDKVDPENGTNVIKLGNEIEQIKLTKVSGSSATNFSADTPIKGAKFKVYKTTEPNAAGVWYRGAEVTGSNEYLETNTDGELVLPRYITQKAGTEVVYWIEETSTAPGYEKSSSPWLIWVTNGKVVALRYVDPDKYANNTEHKADRYWLVDIADKQHIHNKPLELTKVSAANTNKKLDGATFDVYNVSSYVEGKATSNPVTKQYTGDDKTALNNKLNGRNDWHIGYYTIIRGEKIASDVESKNGGKITIPEINESGIYMLFETGAPEGYEKYRAPWLLLVMDDGSYQLMQNRNRAKVENGTIKDGCVNDGKEWWIDNYDKVDGLLLKDDLSPLKLTKVEGTANGHIQNTTKTLAGAQFRVYKATNSGNSKYVKDEEVEPKKVITSDDNGVIELPIYVANNDGDYWIEEVSPAPGYKKASAPWVIWVSDNKIKETYRFDSYTSGSDELQWASNNKQVSLNGYLHNEPVKVTKVNTDGDGLSGVEFTANGVGIGTGGWSQYYYSTNQGIWKVDGEAVILRSDTNGNIDISSAVKYYFDEAYKTDTNATQVQFFLYENDPPTGYKEVTAPWLITVTRDGAVTVEAYDDRYADFEKPSDRVDGHKHWIKTRFSPVTASGNINANDLVNDRIDLEIGKIDTVDSGANMAGVEFKLFEASVDSTGKVFTKANASAQGIELTSEASDSGSGGVVKLNGIGIPATGTKYYLLFETKTASKGYILPSEPWVLVIKDGKIDTIYGSKDGSVFTGNETNWNIDTDYEEVGQLKNHQTYTLPSTGGAGTLIMTMLGVIITLVAAFWLQLEVRMGKARR